MSTALNAGQYAFGVAVALAALGAVLWALRRAQRQGLLGGHARRLQVLETLALGPRHRLALVRVDGRELVLGITPAGVAALDVARPAAGAPGVPAGSAAP